MLLYFLGKWGNSFLPNQITLRSCLGRSSFYIEIACKLDFVGEGEQDRKSLQFSPIMQFQPHTSSIQGKELCCLLLHFRSQSLEPKCACWLRYIKSATDSFFQATLMLMLLTILSQPFACCLNSKILLGEHPSPKNLGNERKKSSTFSRIFDTHHERKSIFCRRKNQNQSVDFKLET